MQAQLKSASADFGCPNIISQNWEQGLPYMHLSWLRDFWPAHWRRCTALYLIQNTLWKSSKCLMDRLRTPLAEKQIPPIPPLPPPSSLLEEFNTKYRLWTRGSKTVREHTAIEWKSKPALLDIILRSPPGQRTELMPRCPELCVGPGPSLGPPWSPGKAKTGSLYLRALPRELWKQRSELIPGPFEWPPQIQQHPPLSARGRGKAARVTPSDKMIKPSQWRSV